MGYNIFGSGPFPTLFKKTQNNGTCCDTAGGGNVDCSVVLACLADMMDDPFIPFWDGTSFDNSALFFDSGNNAVRILSNAVFASATPGEAQLENSDPSEWFMSTDGGAGLESWMLMSPTDIYLVNIQGGIHSDAFSNDITHTIQVLLDSPVVSVQQNKLTGSSLIGTLVQFGAAGDEFNVSTDAGALLQSGLLMNATYTSIFNAAGGGYAGLDLNGNAPGWAELKATVKVYLNTSLIETQDAGAFDVDTAAGTYSMFPTNASIVNLGRVGGTLNVLSGTLFTAAMVVNANIDGDTFSVNGTAGASFSGAITNITVVNGIVTAAS